LYDVVTKIKIPHCLKAARYCDIYFEFTFVMHIIRHAKNVHMVYASMTTKSIKQQKKGGNQGINQPSLLNTTQPLDKLAITSNHPICLDLVIDN
jgi:hypothetical protein